jgi:hypothetical protein
MASWRLVIHFAEGKIILGRQPPVLHQMGDQGVVVREICAVRPQAVDKLQYEESTDSE